MPATHLSLFYQAHGPRNMQGCVTRFVPETRGDGFWQFIGAQEIVSLSSHLESTPAESSLGLSHGSECHPSSLPASYQEQSEASLLSSPALSWSLFSSFEVPSTFFHLEALLLE